MTRDERERLVGRISTIIQEADDWERTISNLKLRRDEIDSKIEEAAVELADLGIEYAELTGSKCTCEFLNRECKHDDS